MRQQAGHTGRTGRRAAAVLVAGDDQLDQWYVGHPEQLLGGATESTVVNPSNPFVLRPRVACAAHEIPLEPSDERWFGPGLDDAVREFVLAEQLKPRAGKMYWATREPPAPQVGLRTGSSVEFRLVGRDDDGDERLVGTVDSTRVFHVAHPGALYLHQGRQWRVERLDVDDHVAWLEPADEADEYTQVREDTDISITGEDERVQCGPGWAHLGSVDVTNHILAFQRKRSSTNETIEVVPLDLPPRTLPTHHVLVHDPLPTLVGAGSGAASGAGRRAHRPSTR